MMNTVANSVTHASRRDFLVKTGVATALASGAAQAVSIAAPVVTCDVPLSAADNACLRDVALADFVPLLGQQLRAYAPGNAAMLTLVEATGLPARGAQRPKQARSEPFSLVFRGDIGAALEAGIHEFEHEKLGTLKLSLNEIRAGKAPAEKHYEVVFG